MDKILVNQNNLEIEKENLELEHVYKQEESLSKTPEELTDSNVSVIFSKIFDVFSASHSMKMNFINFDNFDVYLTLKDFNLCEINCNTVDGAKLVLNESGQKFIDILKPDDII